MKKALIIGGGCVIGILLLLVLSIIILLQPATQKALVLNSLKKEYSEVDLRNIQVSREKVVLDDFILGDDTFLLEVGSATLEGDLVKMLLGKSVNIERLSATGVQVKIKEWEKREEVAKGLRRRLTPGRRFHVNFLSINGNIETPAGEWRGQIDGETIGAGMRGRISWDGEGALKNQEFSSIGEIIAGYDLDGDIEKLELDGRFSLGADSEYGVSGNVKFTEDVEIYNAQVTLGAQPAEKSAPLLQIIGNYAEKLDRLELAVQGEFNKEIVRNLATNQVKEIPEDFQLDLDFQGIYQHGKWVLDRGIFDAQYQKGNVKLELLKPCQFDIGKGTFKGIPIGAKIIEIDMVVPTELVFPEKLVTGPSLQAKLFLENQYQGFELKPEKTLDWKGLSWMKEGKKWTNGLEVSALPILKKSGEAYSLDLRNFSIQNANSKLIEGSISLDRPEKEKRWQWDTEIHLKLSPIEQLVRIKSELKQKYFSLEERATLRLGGELEESKVRITSGKFEIANKWTPPWFRAETLKDINLSQNQENQLHIEQLGRLMEIQFRELEAERLGELWPNLELNVSPISSHWALTNDIEEGLIIHTLEPIALENVTFGWDKTTYVQRGLVEGMVEFKASPNWELKLNDVRIGHPENPVATGNFVYKTRKEQEASWKGNFDIELPQASRSVLFNGKKDSIQNGTCQIHLEKEDPRQGTLVELALRDTQLEKFPDETLNLDVDIRIGMENAELLQVTFQVPEGETKVSKGKFTGDKENNYTLKSESLYLNHCLILAETYSSWKGEPKASTAKPVQELTPEALPQFTFTGNLEKFFLQGSEPMQNVSISLESDKDQFLLKKYFAKLGEGQMEGTFHYKISPSESSVTGSFEIKDILIEHFLPPPEEGKFTTFAGLMNLGMTLNSQSGTNPKTIMEGAEVQLQANIKNGHYYFSEMDEKFDSVINAADKIKKVGEGVKALPLIGDKAEQLTNTAQNATKMIGVGSNLLESVLKLPGVREKLTKVEFDSLQIQAHRELLGKTRIETLKLRGPSISVDAEGEIASIPLTDIHNGTLNLHLTLGTKGVVETFFGKLGQLQSHYNPDGYRLFKANPLRITGTLGQPRLRDLWKVIFPAGHAAAPNGQNVTPRKVYDPEKTPGLHPPQSPLHQAIRNILPF